MAKIVLTQEIAEQFAGALLAVVRADHEIQPSEGRAVQDAVAEFVDGVAIDFADVMLLTVTPSTFARAVAGAGTDAYRGPSVSTPAEIATAFSLAARQVAGSDGELSSQETAVLNRFINALGR